MIPRFISYGAVLCAGVGIGWLGSSRKVCHPLENTQDSPVSAEISTSQNRIFDLLQRIYEVPNEADSATARKELEQLKEALRRSLPSGDGFVQKYRNWQSTYAELPSLDRQENMVQVHGYASNRLTQISILWQDVFMERFYQVLVDGSAERPSTPLEEKARSSTRAQQFIQQQVTQLTAALNFLQSRFQGAYPSSATSLEWKKAMADLYEIGVLQWLALGTSSITASNQ